MILITGVARFIGTNFLYYYLNKYPDSEILGIDKGKIGNIYNIGGNNEWKNIDIAQLILSNLRDICNDGKITIDLLDHVYDRLGHDYHYAMNATKIKTQLKWKPSVKFTDGIKSTINWYVNH